MKSTINKLLQQPTNPYILCCIILIITSLTVIFRSRSFIIEGIDEPPTQTASSAAAAAATTAASTAASASTNATTAATTAATAAATAAAAKASAISARDNNVATNAAIAANSAANTATTAANTAAAAATAANTAATTAAAAKANAIAAANTAAAAATAANTAATAAAAAKANAIAAANTAATTATTTATTATTTATTSTNDITAATATSDRAAATAAAASVAAISANADVTTATTAAAAAYASAATALAAANSASDAATAAKADAFAAFNAAYNKAVTGTGSSSGSGSGSGSSSGSGSGSGFSEYYDTNTYNHYDKKNTIVYYEPDGTFAYLTRLPNGSMALVINNNVYMLSSTSQNKYVYNGNTASIITTKGERYIRLIDSDGNVTIYSPNQKYTMPSTKSKTYNKYKNGTVTYKGPHGTVAILTTSGNIRELFVTFRNNKSSIFYSDTADKTGTIFIDSHGSIAIVNRTNKTIVITTRYGEKITYNKVSNNNKINIDVKYGSLSKPSINENLYMLKSQIVPPVCPVCPPQIIKNYIKNYKIEKEDQTYIQGHTDEKVRYGKQSDYYNPEQKYNSQPGFSIPNLNNYKGQLDYSNPEVKKYLPMPVLNSFSSFGL